MERNADILDEMLECGDILRAKKVVMVLAPDAYVRLCSHGADEIEISDCRAQANKTLKDLGNPHLVEIVMLNGSIASVEGWGGKRANAKIACKSG